MNNTEHKDIILLIAVAGFIGLLVLVGLGPLLIERDAPAIEGNATATEDEDYDFLGESVQFPSATREHDKDPDVIVVNTNSSAPLVTTETIYSVIASLGVSKEVRKLDLSNRNFRSLKGLEEYTKLVLLDLSGNKNLKADEVEALRKQLPNCAILYVDESIPEEMEEGLLKEYFFSFGDSQRILRLIATQLNKQPEQVTNEDLLKIKKLDLTDQPISDISCLAGLPKLISLDISGTKITKVPTIKSLRVLTALDNADLIEEQLAAIAAANPRSRIINPEWKMRDIISPIKLSKYTEVGRLEEIEPDGSYRVYFRDDSLKIEMTLRGRCIVIRGGRVVGEAKISFKDLGAKCIWVRPAKPDFKFKEGDTAVIIVK